MFHRISIGMTASLAASLLAIPVIAQQQYPPPQQQAPQYQQYPQQPPPPPYPPQQGQYPPQQGQYPPQQGQYPPQQAQYPPQQAPGYAQPVNLPPDQLDSIVSRIALYPDPLLAQVLAASTFPDQIQPAAQWADQHHYLTGAVLAQAIQGDQLTFDPSVQALLPFPSVLDMMASDMNWTASLGNAFLSQGPMVQDAVQRMRHRAYANGYLQNNEQIAVNNGPYITIDPVNPGYIVVPYYDPALVFYHPFRPGFGIGINFGFGVTIGSFFNPWGWGGVHFGWDSHALFINNAIWGRTWANRYTYAHPYAGIERRAWGGPGFHGAEQHRLEGRSAEERFGAAVGHAAPRESHGGREERRR